MLVYRDEMDVVYIPFSCLDEGLECVGGLEVRILVGDLLRGREVAREEMCYVEELDCL